jgi:hypothetical protein
MFVLSTADSCGIGCLSHCTPRWLFGEWVASSTLTSFTAPLGPQFLDEGQRAAEEQAQAQAGGGDPLTYTLRWFSTLPDTWVHCWATSSASLRPHAGISFASMRHHLRRIGCCYVQVGQQAAGMDGQCAQ